MVEIGAGGSRKQTVIAFADVVGYSALMATDEARTLDRWMSVLDGVVRPAIQRHSGRIVDLAGDGVLAEFAASQDALAWARDLQTALRSRSKAEGPGLPPIVLRVAINTGLVLATGGRIFGDAVNVAARLQSYAEPGGIVLSKAAYEQLPSPPRDEARDLGPLRLKNIATPAHAFAIDTYSVRVAPPMPVAQAPLPSLAVLPLLNAGHDPRDDYFADGIVEDIILSLSGLHELFVVSRASTLAFRGREIDPRDVGQALGVRYVLSGSVRRSETIVRISADLHDAETGGVLWGDRVEAPTGGLFDLQERIVERVVVGLAPSVRGAEMQRAMRKRPESLTAYDCMLRAMDAMRSTDRGEFNRSRGYLAKAMEEDPGFALPVAWAARWHSLLIGQGWSSTPAQDASAAMDLADRALGLDPNNALALAIQGHMRAYLLRRPEEAMEFFDQALAACPNSSLAWTLSSAALSYLGRGSDAVRHAERGLRLSPFDPLRFSQHMFLAIAHYANGTYEDAVWWARVSTSENPVHAATLKALAVSLAALGRAGEAREATAQLLELEPDLRLGEYGRSKLPIREPALRERFLAHLREAGVPE
jgi:adenylate cyclase